MISSRIRCAANQWLCLFPALACAIFSQAAAGGALGISPVKLTFSGAMPPTEIMSVRNDADQAAVIQVELAAWTQEEGRDVYTPTQDLLATPPIFTVPAGASQIIRVGLRRPADSGREMTYRMFLQEVPPPQKNVAMGLQVALRISVPIFVEPAASAAPDLHWRAKRIDDRTLGIEAVNAGGRHDHVSALKIYRAGNREPLASQQLFAYLLPGQSRLWSIPADAMPNPGDPLRIVAHTEAGEIQTELVMDKP